MDTYNWRTNRETRLVWLHFEINSIGDIEHAKGCIEGLENEIENNFLRDYIDFSKINRDEIKEKIDGEIEE